MKSRSTFYQVRKAVIFSVNGDFQPNYERARHIQPCHTPVSVLIGNGIPEKGAPEEYLLH